MPEDATAAAAPVEQRFELLHGRAVLLQEISHELRVMLAAAEEVLGVGVTRPGLSTEAGGRERQAALLL